MSWMEVTVLVDQAKLGDRAAYGELVQRFQSAVYAMALSKVHDPLEAQELAQEVFVHAMRKLPQLRDARCFAGWLRRITARMAINRLTRRGPVYGAEPEVLDAVQS
ncbi:MAG TPA: sigma factor, partial [Gemmataceae bacterium]